MAKLRIPWNGLEWYGIGFDGGETLGIAWNMMFQKGLSKKHAQMLVYVLGPSRPSIPCGFSTTNIPLKTHLNEPATFLVLLNTQ